MSVEKAKFKDLRRLLGEFKPFKTSIAVVLVLGLIVSAIQPLCVKLVEQIVDQLQNGVPSDFFTRIPMLVVGVFAVSGIAKYFYNTIRRNISERVILKLREDLFRKYLYFPLSVIHRKKTGDMLSSVQNDLVQVNVGLDTIADIAKEPFAFIGLLGMAFYCDWRLALSTLIVAPLVVTLFSKSGAAVKRYSSRNMELFSDIISLSQESIAGSQVIKVFKLESPLVEKFLTYQRQYFHTLWKSIRVQELATPAVEFIGALLIAGVLIYGGYRISIEELTTGQLIAFVIALGLAQMPIKKLNNAYLKIKQAEAAAERIYSTLDLASSEHQTAGRLRIDSFDSEIEFQNVTLNYGEKKALESLNFTVKRGDCIALVGQSGSGKSSILSLLARLYEPSSGKIILDGKLLSEIYIGDLRSLVSFVSQETFLFHDTLYENIRYGNPMASKEEVLKAAALAHCNEFLGRFPSGIETMVGDRGVTLSGGERQRVAIARAILKAAPILVLDEATSNLDSESERLVQEALESLMEGKTTFLVAHRFSTIRRAERILVLEKGKISQLGSHQALIDLEGPYRKLYQQQASLSLS